MGFNSEKYQTVVLQKSQLDRVKKLAKLTRMPATKVVGFAIDILLSDPAIQKRYKEWVRVA